MMMTFDAGVKVTIDICKNGVYVLGSDSSSGKTYLANICKSLSTIYDSVFSVVSYMSGVDESIYKQLINRKCRICIVDRYDMFASDELSQELRVLGEDHIVLVGCKDIRIANSLKAKRAGIALTKDEVKVYEISTCFRR